MRCLTIRLSSLFSMLATSSLAIGSPYWKQGLAAPAGLTARYLSALAYDRDRVRVVLFGGLAGSALMNDTWEYDGDAWVAGPAAPAGLTPRAGHTMAFDSVRKRVILFGGSSGGFKNDTWEYDGAAWTAGPVAPGALSARTYHAMAFDGALGRTVIFGGNTASGRRKDTWEFDGASWTAGPAAPAGLTARMLHAMAYDASRGVIVLFGGDDGANRNDTWEFDGISWTPGPAAPASLTPRYSHRMAYDGQQGRVILFGGYDIGSFYKDAWAFDGTGWSAGAPAPAALTPRADLAMGAWGQKVIVFGGGNQSGLFSDTWEYHGRIVDHVVGQGLGYPNPNRVRVFTAAAVPTSVDFYAYAAGQHGTNVASGLIEPTVESQILTGPGPGAVYGPQVRGWLRDGASIAKVNFYAYATLRYGVNVSCGNLDGNGYTEILTGPGPGVVFGPTVRAFHFDGASLTAIARINFWAYAALQYGANVTGGDVDGDGFDEILTGPGPGPSLQPEVRGFNFDGAAVSAMATIDFNAFSAPQYGVLLSAGSVDVDRPYDEILCAPGPGPALTSRFLGYNYDNAAIAPLAGCDVIPFPTHYGGRVGDAEVTGDTRQDLLAGGGPDPAATSEVKVYRYSYGALTIVPPTFVPFAGGYGVNPTGGALGY